jgi:glycerol uptake facilitator-like aquaporin
MLNDMLSKAKAAPVVAEFLGTGLLVMVALVLSETTAVSYFIATSLAVTLAAIVMLFGSVSGAHVNPGVTFGMWTARKIGTIKAISFVAAQLLGGLASWQLYQYFTEKTLPVKNIDFSTNIWVAELVGTAILAMAVAAIVTRKLDAIQSALVAGTAIFAGVVVAATAGAGFINPAIALGERAWSSVYVLGPLVGGLVGVNLYVYLFAPDSPKTKVVKALKVTRKKR